MIVFEVSVDGISFCACALLVLSPDEQEVNIISKKRMKVLKYVIYVAANVKALAMWRHSVFRPPIAAAD